MSIPTLKQTITSLHNIPYTGDKNITNIDACVNPNIETNNHIATQHPFHWWQEYHKHWCMWPISIKGK